MKQQTGDFKILIIDDEQANVLILEGILRGAGYLQLYSITDPRQALPAFLQFRPDIILLDIEMPHIDGMEIVRQLAPRIASDDYLPIVLLAENLSAEVRKRALSGGAKDFLQKPLDAEEVPFRIANLLETRSLYQELRKRRDTLQEEVQERTEQLERAQKEILQRLAHATEYRDDETGEHSRRVGELSGQIAREMGLEPGFVTLVSDAAPLHDIGKIAIPESILLKPRRLTSQELESVKTHTLIGAKILSGSTFPLLQLAEEIALTHHERWDGTGYSGLSGTTIPISGRIVALADAFDGLTHKRPYRPARTRERAIAEIRAQSGRQFDPDAVIALELALATPSDSESKLRRAEADHALQQWQIQLLGRLSELRNSPSAPNAIPAALAAIVSANVEAEGGCLYVFDEGESEGIASSWGTYTSSQPEVGIIPPIFERLKETSLMGVRFLKPRDVDFAPRWRHCISVPLTSSGASVGVLELIDAALPLRDISNEPFFRSLGEQAGSTIRNAVLCDELRHSQEQLSQLSHRLVGAQEDEKARIARDLHDEVGQILTGLKMTIDLCSQLPPDAASEHLVQARSLVADALSRVRNMTLDLRPAALQELGLIEALHSFFRRYRAQTRIEVHFKPEGDFANISREAETTAFRIVQEALTNVARHAGTKEAWVRLNVENEALHIQIEDRGEGFEPSKPSSVQSSGLTGMSERAKLVGGNLRITSSRDGGTLVEARLPLAGIHPNTDVEAKSDQRVA